METTASAIALVLVARTVRRQILTARRRQGTRMVDVSAATRESFGGLPTGLVVLLESVSIGGVIGSGRVAVLL